MTSSGDFDCDAHAFVGRHGFAREAAGQGFPFEILHHQKIHAILAADVIKHTDVWMLQSRDGLGLALETGPQVRVLAEMGRQELGGDFAVKAGIPRPVDFAHPSRAKRRLNFIRAEFRARG
jgi:hypothetical protein